MSVALVVPTLNAGPAWHSWLDALDSQTVQPDLRILVDSCSTDETVDLARSRKFTVYRVGRARFNHGTTRQMALTCCSDVDIVVYMTQDAILATPYSLARLLSVFEDRNVAIAFGRQLPHNDAGPIEQHSRHYLYPEVSRRIGSTHRSSTGTVNSNAFAAYTRTVLLAIGGFPRAIVSEDTIVAHRAMERGWQVAYVADAEVRHSHRFTIAQEARRYFDIGVSRVHNPELAIDTATDGMKYVVSELKFLFFHAPYKVPEAIIRNAAKWVGYYLGLHEHSLPYRIKVKMTQHTEYWRQHVL